MTFGLQRAIVHVVLVYVMFC